MKRKLPKEEHSNYPLTSWQRKLHEIIFEAETPAGKFFDVLLLIFILLSVVFVMLESVKSVQQKYGELLLSIEWFFTIAFTIEYIARLISVASPKRYAFSFLGLVDLLSILPTYLSLLVVGTQSLIIIRMIRLLRVFRIFKLTHFLGGAHIITSALKASREKIIVFLIALLCLVVILGTVMYLIEGEENGFTSIPVSVYWAIVTMTTVGYGDIVPLTAIGKAIASLLMITGYGIIAVPTGIVTSELVNINRKDISTECCPNCSAEGHDKDAVHCKYCGSAL